MAESNIHKLYFDPDQYPGRTLKAFNEFVQLYLLRYNANYSDPPKVSMDAAIQRWKIDHGNANPNVEQFDTIKEQWQAKDKVAKFLRLYSSSRFYSDWQASESNEENRKNATWQEFITKMRAYYKPTENCTLKNYLFRSLSQESNETFMAYCNRVEKESKHCEFNCPSETCTAEAIAVRDQIIIGLRSENIREEALKESWNLHDLRINGMRLDSAARGAIEITGDSSINKSSKSYI